MQATITLGLVTGLRTHKVTRYAPNARALTRALASVIAQFAARQGISPHAVAWCVSDLTRIG